MMDEYFNNFTWFLFSIESLIYSLSQFLENWLIHSYFKRKTNKLSPIDNLRRTKQDNIWLPNPSLHFLSSETTFHLQCLQWLMVTYKQKANTNFPLINAQHRIHLSIINPSLKKRASKWNKLRGQKIYLWEQASIKILKA